MVVLAAVLAAALAFGIYLSWTAGRIDRLHARVEAAAAALDAQLVRRAAAALAAAGRWAPAAPERAQALAGAARAAQAGESLGPDREIVENALSRVLRATAAVSGAPASDQDLLAAARRVTLARNFYNDAVRDTRSLRGRWLPRTAHLAGRAPLPGYFEIDDTALLETDGAAPLTPIPPLKIEQLHRPG